MYLVIYYYVDIQIEYNVMIVVKRIKNKCIEQSVFLWQLEIV